MSWNVFGVGSKDGCSRRVTEDPHIPAPVKEAVESLIRAMPEGRGVAVETSGHVDSANGSLKVEIRSTELL